MPSNALFARSARVGGHTMGDVNVCEAVGKVESVRTLVYITSDKCYRNENWEWGYRETDALGGRNPYSASKACPELVFSAYWNSFLSRSDRVKAASTRAGNVIGGGDRAKHRLVPDCIRALRQQAAIEIRHPDSIRPWPVTWYRLYEEGADIATVT